MRKEGYRESTIRPCIRALRAIAKRTNLLNRESVKSYLASTDLSENRKEKLTHDLSRFYKWKHIPFEKPTYRRVWARSPSILRRRGHKMRHNECGLPSLKCRETIAPEGFIMRSYGRILLRFEHKPTISGEQQPIDDHPVGGEILPVNSLRLFLVNFWWIFLLAVPILMYWLTARYGVRIPPRVRLAFKLVPLVIRIIG